MDDEQIIATIRKNARESVVVRLRRYEGHHLVDVRVFYDGPEGELKPTGKGASFAVRLLPEVIAGLVAAQARARELGQIGGPG